MKYFELVLQEDQNGRNALQKYSENRISMCSPKLFSYFA